MGCGLGAICLLLMVSPFIGEEHEIAVQTESLLTAIKGDDYGFVAKSMSGKEGANPKKILEFQKSIVEKGVRPLSWQKIKIDLVPSTTYTEYSASGMVAFEDGSQGEYEIFWQKEKRGWSVSNIRIYKNTGSDKQTNELVQMAER
jgi:hypothetical protein